MLQQIFYRGQRGYDTFIVRYRSFRGQGHIIVHPHQYTLALYVYIFDGFFRHGFFLRFLMIAI